jgi:hypothetical protein
MDFVTGGSRWNGMIQFNSRYTGMVETIRQYGTGSIRLAEQSKSNELSVYSIHLRKPSRGLHSVVSTSIMKHAVESSVLLRVPVAFRLAKRNSVVGRPSLQMQLAPGFLPFSAQLPYDAAPHPSTF